MNHKKVLVIGSTCVDVILTIDHLPVTGEDLHPFGQSLSIGGCAYNVAHVLAQFSTAMTFITPVGTGIYGEFIRNSLESGGFARPVCVNSRDNGCCYCLVEKDGERTFLSLHGAEYTFEERWMKDISIKDYAMVYICGLEIEEPTGEALIHYLETQKGPEVFFAPGPRGYLIEKEKWDRMMALHPVLHINQQEAGQLAGLSSWTKAAQSLRNITGNTVIVTLGNQGAYALEQSGEAYTIPAVTAVVADTIGAGDSHIGTILAFLSRNHSMKEAIAAANAVSSAIVSVNGASLSDDHPLFQPSKVGQLYG